MDKQLQKMMSEVSYKELQNKVKDLIGEKNFNIIFPLIVKELVNGDRDKREQILIGWLDMSTCRVCSICGEIMSEGWCLNDDGYACSDECAAKNEGISMEEFSRYQIYKNDLIKYLKDEGEGRTIEDLEDWECSEIIESEILDNVDYYYTEWYECW